MRFEPEQINQQAKRGERGAALITVLWISTLILVAGGALIMVTNNAQLTAIDSTAEMQAYYAAESGLESTLNVLRGNVNPVTGMPPNTKINFRNALDPSTSNKPSDSSTTGRLSGWLNYDYRPAGFTDPDRVSLTSGYTPTTGLAFSVAITDPDNTPVAAGEPQRLVLDVTGYGPKGAIKRLELIVKRTTLDYSPPAPLMMRGDSSGVVAMNFTTGDSAAKDYTGHDRCSPAVIPSFGSTDTGDMNIEIDQSTKNTVQDPLATTVADSGLPSWLQTADNARSFISDLKALSIEQGQYYSTFDGYAGTDANPQFTFVDGNCILDGGAGLLVVTGDLEMDGNPSFNGLILVLGTGSVNRDGGGNGNIFGAIAVAKFDQNGTGGFLAPTFYTNGSGNATIQYDSCAVRRALNIAGPRVLGVHEY